MIPSLVDTSLDFGLFRVVRPYISTKWIDNLTIWGSEKSKYVCQVISNKLTSIHCDDVWYVIRNELIIRGFNLFWKYCVQRFAAKFHIVRGFPIIKDEIFWLSISSLIINWPKLCSFSLRNTEEIEHCIFHCKVWAAAQRTWVAGLGWRSNNDAVVQLLKGKQNISQSGQSMPLASGGW